MIGTAVAFNLIPKEKLKVAKSYTSNLFEAIMCWFTVDRHR